MSVRRHRIALLLSLVAGAAVAVAWVLEAGGSRLAETILGAGLPAVLAGLALTACWHFVRFVRWQFLLRRIGVRVPIRPALGIYLAGSAGTATPAYVGEGVRSLLLRRRFGVPYGASLPVLVLERFLDVAALSILVLIVSATATDRLLGAGVLAAAVGGAFLSAALAARLGVPRSVTRRLLRPSSWGPALAGSLAAWALAGLTLGICAASLDLPVSLASGARTYWAATILGGLTLMPAGVGVTGSAAIFRLLESGVELTGAVAAVSLLRLLTVGASLTVGGLFLAREAVLLRRPGAAMSPEHFHDLREEYLAQFSAHVWEYLTERKVALIEERIREPVPPGRASFGLDLGCGVAAHGAALSARGHSVVGVDRAWGLLAHARTTTDLPLLQADARRLPFRDRGFDFVYAVGVLHHLETPSDLDTALAEVRRVLQPGGRFLVLETNPMNPLFRFYMGYLFPLLRRIDEGVENWIAPAAWGGRDGFRLVGTHYFTFIPDFLPRWALPGAVRVERALERSSWRSLSVHYMAVLERTER